MGRCRHPRSMRLTDDDGRFSCAACGDELDDQGETKRADADAVGGMSDPRFAAAIDLIGRTGAKGFQIRYDDEQDPVVWVAYAEWLNGDEAAGALEPLTAVLRLMALVMSGARGARCAHCGNPSGVSDDWRNPLPFSDEVCWFVFDPELAKYRRSCEGDTTGYAYGRDPATGRAVGRNNPCPCGSGFKWKRCHGRGTT